MTLKTVHHLGRIMSQCLLMILGVNIIGLYFHLMVPSLLSLVTEFFPALSPGLTSLNSNGITPAVHRMFKLADANKTTIALKHKVGRNVVMFPL